MIMSANDTKWKRFESSGKISDYLEYRGISVQGLQVKGDNQSAYDDSKGACGIGTQRWGK